MRFPAVLVLCVAAASCGKGGDKQDRDNPPPDPTGSAAVPSPTGPTGPTGTGPTGPGMVISVGGKPVPGARGFVKRRPDGTLQAYVGDGGSCQELLVNLFDGDHAKVLIDVPTRVAADGSETPTISLVHVGGGSDAAPDGPATVTLRGSADKGAKLELDVEFVGKGDADEVVVLKGSTTLEGCGDQDGSGQYFVKAPHPSTAVMTVAGKAFPVRGALRKGTAIELSDFPRDCSAAAFFGTRLRLEGSWRLDGARFAAESTGDAKGLVVTPGATGDGPDGPTISLALSGSDKVGDYSVALDGTVEALDCK